MAQLVGARQALVPERSEIQVDPLLALVAPAVAGDARAMRTLLEAVTPTVIQVVRYLTRSSSETDDLAQECLIAFAQALGRFEGRSGVRQYARRIAGRHCVATLKAARHRRALFERAMSDPVREEAPENPSEELASRRRCALVRELVESLPPPQGTSVFLRLGAGLSLDEIAEETDAPVNTVRSRIRLGLKALQERVAREPHLRELLSAEEG